MFDNIIEILDKFESTYNNCIESYKNVLTEEEQDTLTYLSVNLAKALMLNDWINDESVAKIILATKNLSNEITVKVD